MAGQEREPRAYELMTIFLPDLSDEDGLAQREAVSGYITSASGTIKEILTDSPWGRRRLAYTMRFSGVDYRDGVYSVYHFDAAPSAIAEIERELKLDTRTIRYLLVHDDPKAGEKYPQTEGEGADQDGEATASVAEGGSEASAPVASESATPAPEAGEAPATQQEAPAEAPADESPASESSAAPAEQTPAADDEPAATQPVTEEEQAVEAGADAAEAAEESGDSGTQSTDEESAKE